MTARAAADAIQLTVNGRDREVPAGTTVADLLRSLSLDARMVVVEVNREILRDAALHAERLLNAGDTVEIVHFVGGG